MKIVIPSYNRHNSLLTLDTLKRHNIDLSQVYLFLANEEQKELYKVPDEINVIVGILGLNNQRNFITDYFEEGEILVYLDDDIKDFTILEKSLQQVLDDSIEYLKNSQYQLLSFPPTGNEFFNHTRGYKEGLYYCVGGFYIEKNDKSIRRENKLEDIEHTIKSFEKYGKVIRCSDIIIKTKCWGKGGLEQERREDGYNGMYKNFVDLQYKYPRYIASRTKKTNLCKFPIPNFRLKNKEEEVIILPKINPEIFKPLLEMLGKHSFKIKENNEANTNRSCRKNFPKHKADIFGYVKLRPVNWEHRGKYNISRTTEKKIELYNELKRIADIIVPFKWSSVLVNNNVVCGKHLDASNIGESVLLSIGDYEGCNIVVNGKKYDAKYQPLIFNGSKLEHYTTDDLVGNKYSLVFYNILPDDFILG
jgi:hypothetical protein